LVAADTVDQRIIERAGAKRKLEKLVIQKGTILHPNIIHFAFFFAYESNNLAKFEFNL
jgi:hypothetical protein